MDTSFEDMMVKTAAGHSRICVLATYFGPLPNWFGLWAASCGANPDIDFVVVSDQSYDSLPQNVRMFPETLSGIKNRLERAIGTDIVLTKAYKLCDYKPFLGLAYGDLLEGYDYWGHSDLDLFFGDMRACFAKHGLEQYDKFLSLGHFFLYRNTPEVNRACLMTLEGNELWREVVGTDVNCAYDEQGMNLIIREHGFALFAERPFADIATIYSRVRLGPGHGDCRREVFYWKKGKAGRLALQGGGVLSDEEFLYVHFQKRPYAIERVKAAFGEDFYFGSTGFMPMEGLEASDAIAKVNPFEFCREFPEDLRWRCRDLRHRLGVMKGRLLNVRG